MDSAYDDLSPAIFRQSTFIENLTNEHEENIELDRKSEFDLESDDFNLDQIIDSAVDWTSSLNVPIPKTKSQIPPYNESTPSLELKALPEHLKYAYLGKRNPTSHHNIPSD